MKKLQGNTVKENQKFQNDFQKFKNKSLIISLIFMNMLSEISTENKDKASLLYRAFKEYFVLIETNHTIEKQKILQKINFYKELCKTVLSQKQDSLGNIDSINDVLFANTITETNLNNHKDLIKKLLKVLQEKNEEVYLLTSETEIMRKEVNFWIYDYDAMKHDKAFRVTLFLCTKF